jgi:hypothetical protein
MATPHVTGVMALVYPQVRAQHPDWSATDVMGQVIDQVLGTVDVVDGALKTISGGRLNAAGAVGNPPADTTGPRVISTDPGSSGSVTGTVDHVRLRFSESIDPATFDATDVVSMTGPDGSILDFTVAPVAGSSRQFDVTFVVPQTALGVYTLVVGPNISDLSGNFLDQDRDGTGGEDPDDLVTASFEIADTLGWILLAQGDTARALTYLTAASAAGSLVNDTGGVISILLGTGNGGRTLGAQLDNRGLVDVQTTLTLTRAPNLPS